MKRKLIMNLQLFGLGQMPRPFFNADTGANAGGAPTEGTDPSNNQNQEEVQKSFDDIVKENNYQAEIEKIKKEAVEEAKIKWESEKQEKEQEAKKLSKMNSEEKAEYERKKKEDALDERERDLEKRELTIEVNKILDENDMPRDAIKFINLSNAESASESVKELKELLHNFAKEKINGTIRGRQVPIKGNQVNLEDAALRKAMGL